MRFLDYARKEVLKARACTKSRGMRKDVRCLQGEELDSRSVNQSPSGRQRRNWTAQSLPDTPILSTAVWPGSSDTNKGFHSPQHPGCFSFQHLGNASTHSRDSFHNPSLHFLKPLAHPSQTSAPTVSWTSHFTSLGHVLPLTRLTRPQVSVHSMSAP